VRIVVDTGTYDYSNMGDVAMLQVAVTRLKKLWPTGSIEVFTEQPDSLAAYCPGTKPIPCSGRHLWFSDRVLLGRYHRFLPKTVSLYLTRLKRALGRRRPALVGALIDLRLRLKGRGNGDTRGFLAAMAGADLVVVTGAGGFSDQSPAWNTTLLNTLDMAFQAGTPAAMFGQGLGPLEDLETLARASVILPRVSLITLRESKSSLPLLQSLGVASDHILATGDEAIELAYETRPTRPGNGVGVNLRVASYANVGSDMIKKIRPVLHAFAGKYQAPLISVPISFSSYNQDHETIKQLLAGYDNQFDGGISLNTPLKVMEQVGRCRVVVAGAYHAAVFALAQGIPAVCLTKSPYYVDKFLGLADQFGQGCEIVFLDDTNLSEKLTAAIERTWQLAEMVRLPLQQAAFRQIELSRSAYERVRNLFRSHRALQPISSQETGTHRRAAN